MARYSGGITTHRALTGPRKLPYMHTDEKAYRDEVLATLRAVKSIREACDLTEMRTVREARRLGAPWTEIAALLGVDRDAVQERWQELDA